MNKYAIWGMPVLFLCAEYASSVETMRSLSTNEQKINYKTREERLNQSGSEFVNDDIFNQLSKSSICGYVNEFNDTKKACHVRRYQIFSRPYIANISSTTNLDQQWLIKEWHAHLKNTLFQNVALNDKYKDNIGKWTYDGAAHLNVTSSINAIGDLVSLAFLEQKRTDYTVSDAPELLGAMFFEFSKQFLVDMNSFFSKDNGDIFNAPFSPDYVAKIFQNTWDKLNKNNRNQNLFKNLAEKQQEKQQLYRDLLYYIEDFDICHFLQHIASIRDVRHRIAKKSGDKAPQIAQYGGREVRGRHSLDVVWTGNYKSNHYYDDYAVGIHEPKSARVLARTWRLGQGELNPEYKFVYDISEAKFFEHASVYQSTAIHNKAEPSEPSEQEWTEKHKHELNRIASRLELAMYSVPSKSADKVVQDVQNDLKELVQATSDSDFAHRWLEQELTTLVQQARSNTDLSNQRKDIILAVQEQFLKSEQTPVLEGAEGKFSSEELRRFTTANQDTKKKDKEDDSLTTTSAFTAQPREKIDSGSDSPNETALPALLSLDLEFEVTDTIRKFITQSRQLEEKKLQEQFDNIIVAAHDLGQDPNTVLDNTMIEARKWLGEILQSEAKDVGIAWYKDAYNTYVKTYGGYEAILNRLRTKNGETLKELANAISQILVEPVKATIDPEWGNVTPDLKQMSIKLELLKKLNFSSEALISDLHNKFKEECHVSLAMSAAYAIVEEILLKAKDFKVSARSITVPTSESRSMLNRVMDYISILKEISQSDITYDALEKLALKFGSWRNAKAWMKYLESAFHEKSIIAEEKLEAFRSVWSYFSEKVDELARYWSEVDDYPLGAMRIMQTLQHFAACKTDLETKTFYLDKLRLLIARSAAAGFNISAFLPTGTNMTQFKSEKEAVTAVRQAYTEHLAADLFTIFNTLTLGDESNTLQKAAFARAVDSSIKDISRISFDDIEDLMAMIGPDTTNKETLKTTIKTRNELIKQLKEDATYYESQFKAGQYTDLGWAQIVYYLYEQLNSANKKGGILQDVIDNIRNKEPGKFDAVFTLYSTWRLLKNQDFPLDWHDLDGGEKYFYEPIARYYLSQYDIPGIEEDDHIMALIQKESEPIRCLVEQQEQWKAHIQAIWEETEKKEREVIAKVESGDLAIESRVSRASPFQGQPVELTKAQETEMDEKYLKPLRDAAHKKVSEYLDGQITAFAKRFSLQESLRSPAATKALNKALKNVEDILTKRQKLRDDCQRKHDALEVQRENVLLSGYPNEEITKLEEESRALDKWFEKENKELFPKYVLSRLVALEKVYDEPFGIKDESFDVKKGKTTIKNVNGMIKVFLQEVLRGKQTILEQLGAYCATLEQVCEEVGINKMIDGSE